MRILRCQMMELPGQTQMFNRPYQANLTTDTLNAIDERTSGFREFTAEALAGVAGGVIRPMVDAVDEHGVSIASGWHERRLSFLIEVECGHNQIEPRTQIVAGYTSVLGVAGNGFVDPNMLLYFNNTLTTSSMTVTGPNGVPVTHKRIVDSSHVLSQPEERYHAPNYHTHGATGTHSTTMRPEDLMGILRTPYSGASIGTTDYRNVLAAPGVLKKSRRVNGIASNYLATSVQALNDSAFQHAAVTGSYATTDDNGTIYDGARRSLTEGYLTADHFLNELRDISYAFKTNGCITWYEMCQHFPELAHVSMTTFLGEMEQMNRPAAHDCAGWQSSTYETQFATVLMQAVPAIMMDLMLTEVDFGITNVTLSGQPELKWYSMPTSFLGPNAVLDPQLARFCHLLIGQVFADLSENNNYALSIYMQASIQHDSFIRITYGSNPPVDYNVPSFCDALTSPMISYNPQYAAAMAQDVDQVFSNTPYR